MNLDSVRRGAASLVGETIISVGETRFSVGEIECSVLLLYVCSMLEMGNAFLLPLEGNWILPQIILLGN